MNTGYGVYEDEEENGDDHGEMKLELPTWESS